jgi:hypothetical protein
MKRSFFSVTPLDAQSTRFDQVFYRGIHVCCFDAFCRHPATYRVLQLNKRQARLDWLDRFWIDFVKPHAGTAEPTQADETAAQACEISPFQPTFKKINSSAYGVNNFFHRISTVPIPVNGERANHGQLLCFLNDYPSCAVQWHCSCYENTYRRCQKRILRSAGGTISGPSHGPRSSKSPPPAPPSRFAVKPQTAQAK